MSLRINYGSGKLSISYPVFDLITRARGLLMFSHHLCGKDCTLIIPRHGGILF